MRSMGFKSGFDLEFCIFEDLADRSVVAFNITDGDGLPHCMAVGGRSCVSPSTKIGSSPIKTSSGSSTLNSTRRRSTPAAYCASSAARLIKLALPDSFVEYPIPAHSIEGFCDMNDLYAAPLTKM